MLCYAMLYYTILYYTILYYTILYYTILYYTEAVTSVGGYLAPLRESRDRLPKSSLMLRRLQNTENPIPLN